MKTTQNAAQYESRYKIIFFRTDGGAYVTDKTDGQRKTISEAEILEDIFADPIFADIQ